MPDDATQSPATLPPVRLRVGRLDTVERCRRELARVYRASRCGELSTGDGTRLCFMLQALCRMIEAGDLERRVERLEAER